MCQCSLVIGHCRNLNHTLVEFIGGPEPLCVPRTDFAKHSATKFLTEDRDHEFKMSAHHGDSLREPRLRQQLPCPKKMQRVVENPGVVKGPAPDAYAGASGSFQHQSGSLRCRDIAIADDRNAFHRCNNLADTFEVDGAAKALLARAAMNKNRGY